eukprot:841558-Rhodomonas_salina.1
MPGSYQSSYHHGLSTSQHSHRPVSSSSPGTAPQYRAQGGPCVSRQVANGTGFKVEVVVVLAVLVRVLRLRSTVFKLCGTSMRGVSTVLLLARA